MKVLIVHAHPEPQSFCSAMFNLAQQELAALGHEVRTSDLYAMDFQPVASRSDFKNLENPDYLVYALEQRKAWQGESLADDIGAELEKLLWCDQLILNFPVFWCSTPAMLKGWIDRVLVSGVTYGGKRFYDRGGLKGKRAMISITIGAQPHMFAADGIHGPLEGMLSHLLRGTLAYTGLSVLPPFVGWHIPYISDAQRAEILEDYRATLGRLPQLEALSFPSLDAFDERLHPLSSAKRSPAVAG